MLQTQSFGAARPRQSGSGRLRKGGGQLRIGIPGSHAHSPGQNGSAGPDGTGGAGLLQDRGPGSGHRPGPGQRPGRPQRNSPLWLSASVPMDEALADVALDFSGRPYLVMAGEFRGERIGDFDVQLLQPFLEAFCVGARLTLHIRFYGENDHHKAGEHLQGPGLRAPCCGSERGRRHSQHQGSDLKQIF